MGGADTVFPETAEKDGGGGLSAGESPGEIAAGGGREYGAGQKDRRRRDDHQELRAVGV